jgi:peptidoglycan/LPS O-acetylase OafA/YrhL
VASVRSHLGLALVMASAVALDTFAEHAGLADVLPAGSLGLRVLTSFATPIGLGSLLAILLDTRRGFDVVSWALGFRAAAPLCLAGCLALLTPVHTPYFWLCVMLGALVASVVVRPDHGLSLLLDQPVLRFLGTLSYAIYLVHITALGLVRRALPAWDQHAGVVFSLGLLLSLVFAWAAHLIFERPFIRWRQRLRRPA